MYYCSFGDPEIGASYTRCFSTKQERDKFIAPFEACKGFRVKKWSINKKDAAPTLARENG